MRFTADPAEEMARPKGFEPLTPRFVVWCSIQLSYGRAGRDAWGAARKRRHRGTGRRTQPLTNCGARLALLELD